MVILTLSEPILDEVAGLLDYWPIASGSRAIMRVRPRVRASSTGPVHHDEGGRDRIGHAYFVRGARACAAAGLMSAQGPAAVAAGALAPL